jgi:hypothetical protein
MGAAPDLIFSQRNATAGKPEPRVFHPVQGVRERANAKQE